MSSTRVLLSFKDNEKEQEILEFLNKKAELIGRGGYIKQLLELELNKEKKLVEPK